MSIIFHFNNKFKLNEIENTGIDIMQYHDKIVSINGKQTTCIIGMLSPKDDLQKFKSNEYLCLEIDIDLSKCFIANSDLDGIENNLYSNSIIPAHKYIFGMYRRPEVLVTESIQPQHISVYNKVIGFPVVFDNSPYIYKTNVLEEFKYKYDDFEETLLSIFFMLMVSKGRFEVLGHKKLDGKTVYVYKDKDCSKVYSLDIKEGTSSG